MVENMEESKNKTEETDEITNSKDSNSPQKEPEKENDEKASDTQSDPKEKHDDPLKEMESKLQEAKSDAKENYDRFLRISAEFENYKKRSLREMGEFRKFANEALLRELLSVVDNLERAIQSSTENSDQANGLVEGVDMTLKEILKTFEKFGASQVECMEKPFDPAVHQAVMREESENFTENTVIRELQKGYLLHERLLRPAMVAVSVAKQKENQEKVE